VSAVQIPLTPELEPLRASLSNRIWRLTNLYWIEDAHGRKVKFRLNWAQQEFLRGMWWLNDILKVRQIGISTLIGLLQLDRCLFNPNQTCGVIDKTDDDAKKKLAKIIFAYEHLDDPEDKVTAALGAAIKQAVRKTVENKKELEFSNASKVWAGTSLRGGTINFLHVSELGPIAHKAPEKAKEIAAGAFNTVHRGNIIVVESTHEGGRYGLNYELIRLAQRSGKNPQTQLDWKFFFFPWYPEPSYALPLPANRRLSMTAEQARYFANLEKATGVLLTDEQKHWWIKKSQTPKVNMAQQFPGTPEEALQAITEGSIYGQETVALRAQGRVRVFPHDRVAPLYTFWDIGMSDFTSIWILALDYFSWHGETPAHYAAQMIDWERHYGAPIFKNFLPHDANNRGVLGKTYVDALREAGLTNVKVVPRTPDVWVGIKHLRSLLPRFYFHAEACENDIELPSGRILPSGLGALEGYHTVVEAVGGAIHENPVHDEASHGCLRAGTGVATPRGIVPIEQIRVGDAVLTPDGVGRVTAAGISKYTDRFVKVQLACQRSVECTPEHHFLSPSGLVRADALRTVSGTWTQETSPRPSSLTVFGISYRVAITSNFLRVIRRAIAFIARCGRFIAALYRRGITSTTRTAIISTTGLKTWSALRRRSTSRITEEPVSGLRQAGRQSAFWKKRFRLVRPGMVLKSVGSGTASTGTLGGKPEFPSRQTVCAVVSSSPRALSINASVADSASNVTTTESLLVLLKSRARTAARSFWTKLVATWVSTAPQSAKASGVVSSEPFVSLVKEPVYDLTISPQRCYFANGILVSNSDALRTFAEAHSRGMLEGASTTAGEHKTTRRKVVTGLREANVVHGITRTSSVKVLR